MSECSRVSVPTRTPFIPLTLVTLNTYLFPVGLRQSGWVDAQKDVRVKHILKELVSKVMKENRRKKVGMRQSTKYEESETFTTVTEPFSGEGLIMRPTHTDCSNSSSEVTPGPIPPSTSSSTAASPPITHSTTSSWSWLLSRLIPSFANHTATTIPTTASSESSSSNVSTASDDSLLSADVVALQEVLGSLWCTKWRTLFTSTLLEHYTIITSPQPSLCRDGKILDAGLLIATRLPVIDSKFVPFKFTEGVNKLAWKGFLHAVLKLERQSECNQMESSSTKVDQSHSHLTRPSSLINHDRDLHIINLHLQSLDASWNLEHAQRLRTSEIEEIRSYLKEYKNYIEGETPLIVVGDFNVQIGDEECRTFQHILSCPNSSILPLGEVTTHSAHQFCYQLPSDQHQACDFAIGNEQVLFRETTVIKDGEYLSDHYPVRMKIAVRV